MRRYLLIFILLFFSSTRVICQYTVTDSLLQIIRSDAPDSIKIDAVNSMPFSIYTPDSILHYSKVIIDEGTRQKSDLLVALGWAQTGYGYSRSDNQPEALRAELVALKIAEKTNNPVVLVTIYENIAISYAYSFSRRMEYARKAVSVISSARPNFFYAVAFQNIAQYFEDNNQLDSALYYAQRAYEIDIASGGRFSKSFISRTLGDVHLRLNNNELALSYYRISLNHAVSKQSIRDLYLSYLGMGKYYEHLRNEDSAFYYYRRSFMIAAATGTTRSFIKPAQWLYSYFKQHAKTDSALYFLESMIAARDSIDAIKKAVELQSISFEEDLRQQDMLADKERLERERSHDIQLALLFIAVLATILLFLLLSRSIIVSPGVIGFLGVLVLLIVFESINLLLHPLLQRVTNDSPFLMLLSLVAIAAVIVPLHHRLQQWATNKLVEKNKAIRLAKARKMIEELERT
jgi:tetratricopeptide (TPR) repeat protein